MPLTLDQAQCTELKRQLESGDVAWIRDVLWHLRCSNAQGCLKAIATSGLGRSTQRLLRHQDVQIAQAAQAPAQQARLT